MVPNDLCQNQKNKLLTVQNKHWYCKNNDEGRSDPATVGIVNWDHKIVLKIMHGMWFSKLQYETAENLAFGVERLNCGCQHEYFSVWVRA